MYSRTGFRQPKQHLCCASCTTNAARTEVPNPRAWEALDEAACSTHDVRDGWTDRVLTRAVATDFLSQLCVFSVAAGGPRPFWKWIVCLAWAPRPVPRATSRGSTAASCQRAVAQESSLSSQKLGVPTHRDHRGTVLYPQDRGRSVGHQPKRASQVAAEHAPASARSFALWFPGTPGTRRGNRAGPSRIYSNPYPPRH